METRLFKDRREAGKQLAERLSGLEAKRPLVLALPRGGVPVGSEIAKLLNCPLDTLVVRKVGTLFNPEFAVGAVGPHDITLLDESWLAASRGPRAAFESILQKERDEMQRRADLYKSGTLSAGYVPDVVILADDGIATGLTARAAALAAHQKYPRARLVFATPVSIGEETDKIRELVDEFVCLEEPDDLYAVGQAYENFGEVSDKLVNDILKRTQKD